MPDIREVPSVVSGDPNDRRSIITAASMPAKKLGIKTAQPVSMALRICPSLVIVRGDWDWYKRCSKGFIEICRSYSPVLQQFSIDECFIDMSERCTPEEAVTVAARLKDQVRDTLGFTVNVGVAHNKLLAKMASDFEKPDKVHTLWEDEIPSKMWPLPVRDLLWVGKQTEAKLTSYGINTIGELAKTPETYLARMLGDKFGHQIHLSANGIDDSPVVTEADEPKSYSNEHTLPKDLTDPEQVDRILFNLACHVGYRIRRDNFYARGVSVFVKDKDFHTVSRQGQMPQPTNVTALILFAARGLLSQIWSGGTPIRQVGLGVFNLSHESFYQLSLFEDEKMDYYRKWDEEYDSKQPKGGGRHFSG
jgi:DNA polymerase-4